MATIKDIALYANVAPSTVSRVLNQDKSISVTQETREKILKAADKFNYKSPRQRKLEKKEPSINIAARSHYHRSNNSQLNLTVVHFLSPHEELSDPFYTSIRIGIENHCHKHNITLRNTFKSNLDTHKGFLSAAHAVICVGHFTEQEVNYIHKHNANLIFVDSNPFVTKFDSVEFDRKAAAQEVVKVIIDSGAKNPAFIGNEETRLHVFREMTIERDIYNDTLCKVSSNFCIESGYQAMLDILRGDIIPDVVFASTDVIAIGAYRAIQESGLVIPDQIKIVGMNDIPTAKHLSPSLTSMRLFPVQMGEAAVDLFLEISQGRNYKKRVILGYEFIWRDSFTIKESE